MKEIKAIIRSSRSVAVIEALQSMHDLHGVTVSEVKGFGHHRSEEGQAGWSDPPDYDRKIKLEIVVPDDQASRVVEAILQFAHTGQAGDGLIFVSTVDEVFRIRSRTREDYSEGPPH